MIRITSSLPRFRSLSAPSSWSAAVRRLLSSSSSSATTNGPSTTSQPSTGAKPPTNTNPTKLARALYDQILFSGPLTVADYMRACLTHPQHGYYTSSAPIFGARGDFVTSPQISPIFSELIAVWLAGYAHANLPRPAGTIRGGASGTADAAPAFNIVELGPGDGALQRVVLPTLAKLRAPPAAAAFVEPSASLTERQRAALEGLNLPSPQPSLSWHTTLDDALATLDSDKAPQLPTLFVAHEMFDALPVHVLQRAPRRRDVWLERLVDVHESAPRSEARFRFVLSRGATPASALLRPAADGDTAAGCDDGADGDDGRARGVVCVDDDDEIVEVCPSGLSVTARIAKHIAEHDGALLVIDYGGTSRDSGSARRRRKKNVVSVRAIAAHGPADLLERPGEADVTADVDFSALDYAARDATDGSVAMRGPVSQRDFLHGLGAATRFRKVAQSIVERGRRDGVPDADVDAELDTLQRAYDRLTGSASDGMGEVYQVGVLAKRDVVAVAGVDQG